MALTDTKIGKLVVPAKDTLVSDGNGLFLRLSPSGTRTWMHIGQVDGTRRKRGLGQWPDVSVAQARAKAAAITAADLNNVTIKVEHAVQAWLDRVIVPSYKRTNNVEVYTRRMVAKFGHRKLDELSTRELADYLSQSAIEHGPVTANRCRTTWSLFFKYGVERGWLPRNPLADTTTRIAGGTEKARDRVLSDDEIRWVLDCPHHFGPLLRALLATGCRISEMQAAKWKHIDGDTLHVPENKSGRPHWVHLTDFTRKQFAEHPRGFLLHHTSPTAVQAWIKRQGWTWTPHDLRRTFATRLAGAGVPLHVTEKCLNHSMSGVMATYNRHDYADERRQATEAWCKTLAAFPRTSEATSNVVRLPLRGAA